MWGLEAQRNTAGNIFSTTGSSVGNIGDYVFVSGVWVPPSASLGIIFVISTLGGFWNADNTVIPVRGPKNHIDTVHDNIVRIPLIYFSSRHQKNFKMMLQVASVEALCVGEIRWMEQVWAWVTLRFHTFSQNQQVDQAVSFKIAWF